MFGFNQPELKVFKKLTTPAKIQDWLETIPINWEQAGDTCLSPRQVLQQNRAHCIEGAMLAAVALRFHSQPPLVVDLKASQPDFDHVIAVFKKSGCWGALSKINHSVLRYRDPIYRNIRELVMSYFHEYFWINGRKTLRSYSLPVDLSRFDKKGWMTSDAEVWYIARYLDQVKHYPLLSKAALNSLRRATAIEIKASNLEQWPKPK